jgi:hypothetical protein
MTSFKANPPPTYSPITFMRGNQEVFNPDWLKWFVDLTNVLNSFTSSGSIFGAVTVNSVNNVAITPPVSLATLGLGSGKTISITNTVTITGVDGKTITLNDSVTVANGSISLANAGALSLAAGKTLQANNTITLSGTDGTTMTFPATNASVARTDAAQSFTGLQTANVKVASAGGNQSSDGSAGLTGTLTTALLVGKTLTFKDGIITGFA